jgi:hypothetical protein
MPDTNQQQKQKPEQIVDNLANEQDQSVDPQIKSLVNEGKKQMINMAINDVIVAFKRSNRNSKRYGNARRIVRDLQQALRSLEDLEME